MKNVTSFTPSHSTGSSSAAKIFLAHYYSLENICGFTDKIENELLHLSFEAQQFVEFHNSYVLILEVVGSKKKSNNNFQMREIFGIKVARRKEGWQQ